MKPYLFTVGKDAGKEKKISLTCKHEDQWPPPEASLPESPERLRKKQMITEHVYQSIQVWQSKCGKKKMNDACSMCPLALVSARVVPRGTGRSQLKKISYLEYSMKPPPSNIRLIYEREAVVLPTEQIEKSMDESNEVSKQDIDSLLDDVDSEGEAQDGSEAAG